MFYIPVSSDVQDALIENELKEIRKEISIQTPPHFPGMLFAYFENISLMRE
jgi:hypothetical protein